MSKISKILIVAFIALAVILIIIFSYNNNHIKKISINDIDKYINKSSYTLLYVGEVDDILINDFTTYKKEYDMRTYIANDNLDTIKEYIKNNNDELKGDEAYLIYDNTGLLGIIDEDELIYLSEYLEKYIYNTIPTPEIYYSSSTANQYISMFNSKDTTIAVFGESSCSYCNLLEHVINDISQDGTYDIYYYNKNKMTESEYNKIMDLDLVIPAECVTSGVPTSFKRDFAKPMTIVTKNGKLIGCIKGYYDKDTYLSKLKEIVE